MKRLLNTHFLSGLLALGLAVTGWVRSQQLSLQSLEDGLGAAFFPWIILAAVALLGAAMVGVGLLVSEEPTERADLPKDRLVTIFGISGSLTTYALLLVPLGFLSATAGFLLVTALILRAPLLPAVIFALLTTAGLWGVFGLALRVPLP